MELLPLVSHIDDPVGMKLFHAGGDGRQIRGGVVESSVALLDEADGQTLVLQPDNLRALALLRQTFLL